MQCQKCTQLLQGREELPRRHSCRDGFDPDTGQRFHRVIWRIPNRGGVALIIGDYEDWTIMDDRLLQGGHRSRGTTFFYERWRALNALTQLLAEWYELE